MNSRHLFLGIDFGTSRSSMAGFNPRTAQVEVIKNAEGEEKTPSVVYFGADGVLVGTAAEQMLEDETQRQRVIVSVKRDLRRAAPLALPGKRVSPIEAAAAVLAKLKRDAEEGHFHMPVERAVITHPASFDPLEQDRLREAADAAGFRVVEILPEPTAAALAYANAGLEVGHNVLVYDLGGGTFDLALLAWDGDGQYRLALEPRGLRCGGDDFDRALYDHCDAAATAQLGRPIALDGTLDLHFLHICRQRKQHLSQHEWCDFNCWLTSDTGPVRFRHTVKRATFEELIQRSLEATVRLTRALLDEAQGLGITVDTLALIGGSSRVPLIQRLLKQSLNIAPVRWQQQDVAVALGAAHEAYRLWGTATPTASAAPPQVAHPAPGHLPATLVVSAAGDRQFRSIADALRSAASGDRILVRPGVYKESLVINRPVEILGDGSRVDIVLTGTIAPCLQMNTDKALVRGLTLRMCGGDEDADQPAVQVSQGRLVLEECAVSASRTAVAVCGSTAFPVLRRCRLQGGHWGASITESAEGAFDDCEFVGCGVLIDTGANPVLMRCRIQAGHLGGLRVQAGGKGTLEDCTVTGRSAPQLVLIVGEGEPLLRRCSVHDGKEVGVLVQEAGRGTLEGCNLYGQKFPLLVTGPGTSLRASACLIHQGEQSGVTISTGAVFRLTDCTVFEHGKYGVLVTDGAQAVLERSRINHNGEEAVVFRKGSSGTVQGCDLTGGSRRGLSIDPDCTVQVLAANDTR